MTDSVKLNLRQKLVQIYNELDHVAKAGTNSKQNYKFVRAADVLRAIRDAFAKWGIYAQTNYELLGTYDIKTNSGGTMHTATVKATIVLFDSDSDETKTISGLGDGADSGDKGIFKAQTGATKNALRNGTLLPDEADPEADESVDGAVEEMPDFQEARHAAPRAAAAPKSEKTTGTAKPRPNAPTEAATAKTGPSQPAQSTATPASSGATAAAAPSLTATAPDVVPEHGDAYEGPDNSALPTETELNVYRQNFSKLGDELSTEGKLKSGRGLPINRKLLVFLLSITGAEDAKTITKAQWDTFFDRVAKGKANAEVGLIGIAKLVNKANGVEEKQK